MKSNKAILFGALSLALGLSSPAHGGLITNNGFEAGLSGWTTVSQLGSEGGFLVQTGMQSPVSLAPVPAPPQGTNAAMTDANGPGSHVLYQDFLVPLGMMNGYLSFSLFINNTAPGFFTPEHLDFASTDLDPNVRINQQVRIDILRSAADAFSVDPGDIVQTIFQTQPSDSLVSGYSNLTVDLSAVILANQGQMLRLRFAEVDNVSNLNLGLDNVDVNAIPEPSTLLLSAGALAALAIAGRRRKTI